MGQVGLATSFFTDKNQNVVRDLIELLRESKQPVPDWLNSRSTMLSVENGGRGKRRSGGGGPGNGVNQNRR
ncbi:unnamed protein product [Protopolystoma xenopodis]|uniref:Uncharacterized protein n=1 Tax=Protopolystoma xenopodis TaxID=117903 RepID=A0A448X7W0_9PLAT|nr:unnamed protein product [Protopolystoma xenopodis]